MQHYYLLLHSMNFKQLEQYFIDEITSPYGEDEARQLFFMVTEHLTGWNRGQQVININHLLTAEQETAYQNILAELKQERPLQHILSESWFYGLKFKVTPAVLIPRPETEELVDWILHTAITVKIEIKKLLDIGTGSGCIAISLKKNMALIEVNALDISEEALAVARENAISNGTDINFIHSDILTYNSEVKYDLIVSNPPYITEEERGDMHRNVLDYEPHLALFVSNENPLLFYKHIADFAIRQLNPKGKLFFEINEYLGKETTEMLNLKGFKNIILRKDMQGKDRMICCNL